MKIKKVKIRSKDWFEKNCILGFNGSFCYKDSLCAFVSSMQRLCGKVIDINKKDNWFSDDIDEYLIEEWMCEPDTWKYEKVKYEVTDTGVCKTKCPNNMNPKVCSGGCIVCPCFLGNNDKKQVVTCSYKKDKALHNKAFDISIGVKFDFSKLAMGLKKMPKYNIDDMQKAFEAGANTKEQFNRWIKDFK